MPLAGRSHNTNSNSYSGRGRRDNGNVSADDIDEDFKEENVNQRISVILFTISRKSRTLQTQTFPSVTIPTALTSSTSRSTDYLGPTPVVISFRTTSTALPSSGRISSLSIPSTISLTIISASSIRSTTTRLPTTLTHPTTRYSSILSISTNRLSSTEIIQSSSASLSIPRPTSTAVGETSASTSGPRLSAATIAGITMAGLVVTLILALLLLWIYKEFRSRKRGSSSANSLYEKRLYSPIRSPYKTKGMRIGGMDIQLVKNQPNAPFSESPGASWVEEDRRKIPASKKVWEWV